MERGRGRSRAVARLLAVLACACALGAVALPLVGGYGYLGKLMATPEVVVAVSFSAIGAVLVGHPASVRMGWILLAVGTACGLYAVCVSWTAFVLAGDASAPLPDDAGLAVLTGWVSGWAWFPAWFVVAAVLPHVVPHGKPLPGPWRIPVLVTMPVLVVCTVAFAVAPGPVGVFSAVDNPFAVPRLAGLLDQPVVLDLVVLALILLGLASVVARVLRADGAERRQVGWVGYALVAAVLVIMLAPSGWSNLGVLLVPLGLAVAALKYRLYDLDLLVNRTLVAGLLLGGAALAYLALVAWIGSLVGSSVGATPFLAAFAVALCFHPARLRVQRAVDRLFYGRRGEPLALLEELDGALREAAEPRSALQAAVEIVRRGLRLTGAAVVVRLPDGGETRARDGLVGDGAVRMPLTLHGQDVGALLVAGRRGEPLGAADLRALQALTGPLASVAYALRLSSDLEESRGRLVAAREEERRRLRRDLHDGLGPQLAGVVMGLDVVRSSLSRGDVDRGGRLADDVTTQAREAVEEVRRLAAGLRPPVLDDLGLVDALRSTGPAAVAGGPDVSIEAEGDLAECPAAVEVAAYRIAQEAITNAVRHAAAGRVDVRLAVSDAAVTVTVSDDGVGLSRRALPGVGLRSMRERASELGGWCSVAPGERGGTTVRAHLPLGAG